MRCYICGYDMGTTNTCGTMCCAECSKKTHINIEDGVYVTRQQAIDLVKALSTTSWTDYEFFERYILRKLGFKVNVQIV